MDATTRTAVDLIVALSIPQARADAARRLAAACGAEDFVLLVRDPELDVLLPAPGLPQTLEGGPSWRAFLARVRLHPSLEEEVELPRGRLRRAYCLRPDPIAAVFIGGTLDAGMLRAVEALLPILAQVLRAEQEARFAGALAADARSVANRAQSLADSLEAARSEHARLNARLHEEHRRKDDFLAMLAHELRNPLTPLVTTIELIRRGGSVVTERHLQIMGRQLRQLSRLVEDLLDVSRVSRGRIELRRHPVAIADVVGEAVESSRPVMDLRQHRVELDTSRERLMVHGDSVRLAQVFANLLHNAAKYTDPGGTIAVSIAREGDAVTVAVRDNGIGIEPHMLESVFDLFAQAPVSLARAQGGLGIGLTLVRALVQLHGGEVSVASDGLGRGSTFSVRLPLHASRQDVVPAGKPALPAPFERALRVLIVDDNEDAADSLAAIFRLAGHHAEVAYSGLRALQIVADVDADLILLDIGLPEMDGYELARRVRRLVRRDIHLVALTGYGAPEDRKRSSEAGFHEHLVKPLMPEQIDDLVRRVQVARDGALSRAPARQD